MRKTMESNFHRNTHNHLDRKLPCYNRESNEPTRPKVVRERGYIDIIVAQIIQKTNLLKVPILDVWFQRSLTLLSFLY